jgi:hypothetical protein
MWKRILHFATGAILAAIPAIACSSVDGVDRPGQDQEAVTSNSTVAMPIHAQAAVTAEGCENSPGPYITLNGGVSLGGLGARLIFTNNAKGTHEHVEQFATSVALVPLGESITIPKQPSQGGSGGNPFIWAQFLDGKGTPLTGELFLGRCVQGLSNVSADFALPSAALADVEALDCTNNPGPNISASGSLTMPGLIVRIIFRNNDNPVGGPHSTVVTTHADLMVMPAGKTLQFPKQPVQGGAGGNPWIYLQYTDGSGAALGNEMLLGRCVQLQPGN